MAFPGFLPRTALEIVDQLGLIPHPEGGFFLETYRSGSIPMSSHGQTDFGEEEKLVTTHDGREMLRPDRDIRRNGLTSIYWLPTLKSPSMWLVCNVSDHVHYYQGGLPFEYITFNLKTQEVKRTILGPDIKHGHVLQLPVLGKTMWKMGKIVSDVNNETTTTTSSSSGSKMDTDYSLIGEAVGPGFDFHDFHFVQETELDIVKDAATKTLLQSFLKDAVSMQQIDEHYTEDSVKEKLTKERA